VREGVHTLALGLAEGCELRNRFNFLEIAWSETNFSGSDHVVHLLLPPSADNCGSHRRVAQSPGYRDRAWERVVALAD